MSISCTQVSNLSNFREYVPHTVTVTAYDTNCNRIWTGGDTFKLIIQNNGSSVPGLPIDATMNSNGDGTYWYTFTLGGNSGTVSATIQVWTQGGSTPSIYAEYWNNDSWSGGPNYAYWESEINHLWYDGYVSPAYTYDYVSGRWTGSIVPPYSNWYTFAIYHDDSFTFTINGTYKEHWGCCDTDYVSVYLSAGVSYPFTLYWTEGWGAAYIRLQWYYSQQGYYGTVPSSSFYSTQNLSGTPTSVALIATSVPNKSTVQSKPTTVYAGKTYSMTMQSRNMNGSAFSKTDDNYTITFTCQGGTCGSQTYSGTASHSSGGLYSYSFIPYKAGTYTVTVTMTNDYTAATGASTTVSGSGYSVIVYPGQIDPAKCYTNLSGSPSQTAS